MVAAPVNADGAQGRRTAGPTTGNSSGTAGQTHTVGGIEAGDAADGDAADGEIIRISLGTPQAFGQVFDRHAPTVHRYLTSRAGIEAADDLLSEVFIAAFRSRRAYDDRFGTVVPWLLGIASNVLRHHYRSEGRRKALLSRLDQRSDRSHGVLDDIATERGGSF